MTWFDAWEDSEVTVGRPAIRDNHGQVLQWVQRTVKCRIVTDAKVVVDADGKERTSTTQLQLQSRIKLDEFVWLPGTDLSDSDEAVHPIRVQHAATKGRTWQLSNIW